MLTPYPNTIPPEDLQIALDAMHGNIPNPREAVHALYNTVGYGLGVIYPDPPPANTVAFTTSQDHVDDLVNNRCKAEALPWLMIIEEILTKVIPAILPLLNPKP